MRQQVLICLLIKNFHFQYDYIWPYHSSFLHIIAFSEELQICDVGNEVIVSDEAKEDDSNGVPIPEYPGAPVFPEAVPVKLTDTSDNEYMADVIDALNKEGMLQYVTAVTKAINIEGMMVITPGN